MSQSSKQEVAIRYLLGNLSDDERDRFEERYFSDDADYEEIEIAEDELLDRYVRGELKEAEKRKFEELLSSSARLLQRQQFARLLANRPSVDDQRTTPKKITWWNRVFVWARERNQPRIAFAFGLLLLLLGGTGLLIGWLRVRETSRELAAQRTLLDQRQRQLDKQAADLKTRADELARQSHNENSSEGSPPQNQTEVPNPKGAPSIFVLALFAGSTRAEGGGQSVKIPPDKLEVEFRLALDNTDYKSYRASVSTVERDRNIPISNLRLSNGPRGPVITFRVSAKSLPPGDYNVELKGRNSAGQFEPANDYPFRINR